MTKLKKRSADQNFAHVGDHDCRVETKPVGKPCALQCNVPLVLVRAIWFSVCTAPLAPNHFTRRAVKCDIKSTRKLPSTPGGRGPHDQCLPGRLLLREDVIGADAVLRPLIPSSRSIIKALLGHVDDQDHQIRRDV